MKRIRQMLRSRRGSVSLVATVCVSVLVGFAAISVDAGYAYMSWDKLQASTQAAALAGAKDIGVGGTPYATAAAYSAAPGGKNPIANATSVTETPSLLCFSGAAKSGLSCSTNQTPTTSANAIQVTQTATVPLFFATILGFPSLTMTANAVALAGGQVPAPAQCGVHPRYHGIDGGHRFGL